MNHRVFQYRRQGYPGLQQRAELLPVVYPVQGPGRRVTHGRGEDRGGRPRPRRLQLLEPRQEGGQLGPRLRGRGGGHGGAACLVTMITIRGSTGGSCPCDWPLAIFSHYKLVQLSHFSSVHY